MWIVSRPGDGKPHGKPVKLEPAKLDPGHVQHVSDCQRQLGGLAV